MKSILLVDDNRTMLLVWEQILIKRGYQVKTARDGYHALATLVKNPQIQFVLSDWMMPGMDGIQLCRMLKSADYPRYIFFVLLSGKNDHFSIVEGINAGADDFIVKDTHVDELDARVQAGFRTLALHNEIIEQNLKLENAYAKIKKDLAIARALVSKLLPKRRDFDGAELSYVSVQSAQVGGDMLGYMQLDDEHIAFYLFDVAGMGVSSALMSFSIQQSIVANTENGSLVKSVADKAPFYRISEPHEVIKQLNDIYFSGENGFLSFTMIYVVLDVTTGKMSFSVAGHPPLVWLHNQSSEAELLGQDSDVVGTSDAVTFKTSCVQLAPEDTVWIYSDGLTTAVKGTKPFSEERLRKSAVDFQHHSTANQANLLINRVKSWQESELFDDDVSVLAVKWTDNCKNDESYNLASSKPISPSLYN